MFIWMFCLLVLCPFFMLCSLLDITLPVISLIGDATVAMNEDVVYNELGAAAVDGVDGDLTNSITVGGDTVNVAIPAIYTVTFDVSDAAGNAANQVTRVVTVVGKRT